MSDTDGAPDAATRTLAANATAQLDDALAGPTEQLGERLLTVFLTSWDNPELQPMLLERIRSATNSEEGAAQLRDHFSGLVLERVGKMVDAPPLDLNAVTAQIVGVIMLRYVLKMEPVASASQKELIDAFAPSMQRHLGA